jgi:pyruvate dehydrogenase E2 component (dihydrolipoamide acetyltransferase)
LATPATRKLARELGVNIANVKGSGPAGRITHEDVRGAQAGGARKRVATQKPPRVSDSPDDVRVPFRGLRRKIAERMALSKQKAAHFTYVEEVDASALVNFRARANERLASQGQKLSFLPFIIKATVEALKYFPQMNATLDEATNEIVQRRSYHIGIASATAEGLMVPVLRDADKRSLIDLGKEVDRLAAVTKTGKATLQDLSGSTFTITSLGTLGGLFATPVINFPEVAILAVHKIEKRPVVVDDKIEIREMVNLSISVDHRLVDGHEAAAFVALIKESLETPGLLFLDSV